VCVFVCVCAHKRLCVYCEFIYYHMFLCSLFLMTALAVIFYILTVGDTVYARTYQHTRLRVRTILQCLLPSVWSNFLLVTPCDIMHNHADNASAR